LSDSNLTTEETNAAAVSAPEPVFVAGYALFIRKVTERDAFLIYAHAKREAEKLFNPIREVLDCIKDIPCDWQTRSELLTTAAKLKAQRAIGDEDITAWLLSPAGVAFRAWILCDRSISLETLGDIVTEGNCLDVFMALDHASGSELVRKAFGGGAANPLMPQTGSANTVAASVPTSTGE
jgi:hypothetical protein